MKRVGGLALIAVLLAGCTSSPSAGPTATVTAPSLAPSTPAPRPSGPAPARTVVALGDSLSNGFDACDRFGDCLDVSWSTGSAAEVDSVATRYGRALDVPVTVRNLARAGAEVGDLTRQTTAALSTDPDLVTVLIGANDVCRRTLAEMTDAAVFARTVKSDLGRLAAAAPEAVVLVASVPDVTALLAATAGDERARSVWLRVPGCETVLDDPASAAPEAETRRAAVRARIGEYNLALAAACEATANCVWDGGALHRYRPGIEQLSPLDYFHPSVTGLRDLAAIEWRVLAASGLSGA